MTKLFEIEDDIDMKWCQAWINDEDESKYFISLEGADAHTKRELTADDFDGYHCVTCNKCPERLNCEMMNVEE